VSALEHVSMIPGDVVAVSLEPATAMVSLPLSVSVNLPSIV